MTPDSLLDAALAYAARGWRVFPCRPNGKEPAIPKAAGGNGVLDATTDETQIRAWWTADPRRNIGLATGTPGPDVLDIDIGDETGLAALATLTKAALLEGRGHLVKTRTGGWHIYFDGSAQRNGSLGPKGISVDFRSTGGYVIAPPSYVDDSDGKPGGPYETVSDGDPQPSGFDWRIACDLLAPPPPFQQPQAEHAARNGDRNWPGDDYATRTSWPDILQPAGWRLMRQIGDVTYWQRPDKQGRGISASTRDDGALWVFSTSTGFDPERPYSKFGAYAVLQGYGSDYKAAAAALRTAGYGDQPPVLSLAPLPTAEAAQDDWWTELASRYEPLDWHKLWDETPDDEEWIIYPVLAAGRSVAIYSPPKVGKSLLALEAAAALAAGRPVLGQDAAAPRRVLYVDLENSRRDIKDRLADLGYMPGDLANLIYLSFPGLPALDSMEGGRHIFALTLAYDITLIVIDTVSRVISGGENDADTFSALYRHSLAHLKGKGVSVLRLDHAGKDVTKGQRGSSAKNADVDAVWTLAAADEYITLTCEMSRTITDVQSIALRRELAPLRHELTTVSAAAVDRTQTMIGLLDKHGIPAEMGRDPAAAELRKMGEKVDTNLVGPAQKARRLRFAPSGTVQTAETGKTGSRPSKTIQTGDSETAGWSPSGILQTDSDGQSAGTQAVSVWAVSAPIGADGQTDGGAPSDDLDIPVCTGCGERHTRYGDGGRPCFQRPAVTP